MFTYFIRLTQIILLKR